MVRMDSFLYLSVLHESSNWSQEHLQSQVSLVLHATLDMNSFFWRAALNRKQHDYGFVFAQLGIIMAPEEPQRPQCKKMVSEFDAS